MKEIFRNRIVRIVFGSIAALVVLVILASSFAIIPTGYTGVRTTFGQINGTVVQNGFCWKIPFIQSITKVNNKQQDEIFAGNSQIWGETSEKVPVYMSNVIVTYQINPERSAWIYTNVTNFERNLVSDSIVSSALKETAVNFTADEVTNRTNIEPLAAEMLQRSLDNKYGTDTVYVVKVVIEQMDFEDSYNEAINNRSLAQRNQETQSIENQTAIDKANAEAEAKKIAAEAEAEATRIRAEAEADANELISNSITDAVLKNRYYDKWDGALPKVITGSGQTLMIDPGI